MKDKIFDIAREYVQSCPEPYKNEEEAVTAYVAGAYSILEKTDRLREHFDTYCSAKTIGERMRSFYEIERILHELK